MRHPNIDAILANVADEANLCSEIVTALAKVGNLADGTASKFQLCLTLAESASNIATAHNELTFTHLLSEQFFDTLAQEDPADLRRALVGLAALTTAWIQDIDQRR